MPRALFFPSYLGGGFGHISRCLALAEALESRGWKTAIALGGPHQKHAGGSGQRSVFLLNDPRPQKGRAVPAFTVLSDLNYQVVRDRLDSPGAVRAAVAEAMSVVRNFQPDVLIADTWLPARMLAHLVGLPLVQIVRSIVHRNGPGLLWWRDRPAGLVSPDPRPVFNPLLERWGLPPIEQAEELLDGDLCLVPSFPELDPLVENTGVCYVGPLVRTQSAALPTWVEEMEPDRPLVYGSAGGGAEGVGGAAFTTALVAALQPLNVRGIISTGARSGEPDLPQAPEHIRLESWVPGPAVIARSQLVVFSGGYGTMMEAVRAGTPGLVIPFHSEQESNARRLEAAGAARILMPVDGEPLTIWRKGRGGRYSVQVYLQSCLTAQVLREQVSMALEDQDLRQGMQRLQAQAARFGGPEQAAGLVEELLHSGPVRHARGIDRLSWWEKFMIGAWQR